MDEGDDGFEDEGKVLCVIVTCRTADGVENVLLSRYYDRISPVAQVTSMDSIEFSKGSQGYMEGMSKNTVMA